MKKLLCILLSCLLVFNSVTLVYADEHGGSGGSFDPITRLQEEHPDWFDKNGHVKPTGSELFNHMIVKGLLPSSAEEGISALYGLIGDYTKNYDNSDDSGVTVHYHDNGQPVTNGNYNENNFYITYSPKFLNGLNDKLQDKVHALDGYYYIEGTHSFDKLALFNKFRSLNNDPILGSIPSQYNSLFEQCSSFWLHRYNSGYYALCGLPSSHNGLGEFGKVYLPFFFSNRNCVSSIPFAKFSGDNSLCDVNIYWIGANNELYQLRTFSSDYYNSLLHCDSLYGDSVRMFYSYQDAINFCNNSGSRSYAPKLPSTNLTIPLAYVNGTLNLPDFNINLDSLIGKAEADIQADIDNQFKLYLDKLAEININPSQPTNPTPTPSGGGSGGDFGDGTTPTPSPDFTDGLKDTNDYLKQILEKVTSILQIDTDFSKSFETVSQNLCKYLESNNEKLDQIITAINALSNGKTEDEVNGCKYDFTQLSQSLTSLWNDSDQKFDQMIKLLEENNKYQEKIIGDLNDIKAILIAQTVLDAFQNRSQETANKAKEKFPTSIPWDIAMIVNTFSAEPEPIKFKLPIKVNSLNINETITVDLSSGEWEKLGKLCRYMLSVLFILFLIQLSRKLFSNGGDE